MRVVTGESTDGLFIILVMHRGKKHRPFDDSTGLKAGDELTLLMNLEREKLAADLLTPSRMGTGGRRACSAGASGPERRRVFIRVSRRSGDSAIQGALRRIPIESKRLSQRFHRERLLDEAVRPRPPERRFGIVPRGTQ